MPQTLTTIVLVHMSKQKCHSARLALGDCTRYPSTFLSALPFKTSFGRKKKKAKTKSNMEDLVRLDCVQKSKHTVALRRETASGSDFAMGRERLTRYR